MIIILLANSNQQSDVAKHLLENPTHYINFNKPKILYSAYNFKELLMNETLLIHQLQPYINVDISSFRLYVFNNKYMFYSLSYVRININYFFFFMLNLASFMMSKRH